MTNWTDHVIRESKRLGISYGCAMTDERVKNSYKKISPKSRPKKVKSSPAKEKRPKGRPKKVKTLQGNERFRSPPVSRRISFSTPSSSLEQIRSPIIERIRSPTPPRKNINSIFREPKIIKRSFSIPVGVIGRKTGQKTKRVVRDSGGFEDIDEFFDQFDD
jgi:hypothetical protein